MKTNFTAAIAGNPNSGKSTLFNLITGAKQHVGNYPGVTVEKTSGSKKIGGKECLFVDLPGVYTLSPFSEDERVATSYILNEKPDLIVDIVDSTSIQRGLFLLTQLVETNIPVILCLNMYDILEKNGDVIDVEKLAEELKIPIVKMSAAKGYGKKELLKEIEKEILSPRAKAEVNVNKFNELEDAEIIKERYAKIDKIIEKTYKAGDKQAEKISDKIDSVLTHKIWGPVLLVLILYLIFQLVFELGSYPEEWLGDFFEWIKGGVNAVLEDGYLKSLLTSGIIDGVGGVMSFVPLIFILFFMIAILEDSGYMARVAFILDRIMRAFGLHGRSVMALTMSGGIIGGCAIPGIMAARTLKNKNERFATIFATPFMSCGAKLPVYALLVATFFSNHESGMMMAITVISWGFALLSSLFLRKTLLKGESDPFIMDLPQYHAPKLGIVLRHAWRRSWLYIKKAGTVILGISILMWAMMAFPELPENETEKLAATYNAELTATYQKEGIPEKELKERVASEVENRVAADILAYSAAGRIGKSMEYITKPLTGFDWRTDIALLGGFAAKEVIVSTLGTAYSMGERDPYEDESKDLQELLAASPDWNPAIAFALILFVMLYAPCFPAWVVMKREVGSWKWTIFSICYSTILGFTTALLAYQIGTLFI